MNEHMDIVKRKKAAERVGETVGDRAIMTDVLTAARDRRKTSTMDHVRITETSKAETIGPRQDESPRKRGRRYAPKIVAFTAVSKGTIRGTVH